MQDGKRLFTINAHKGKTFKCYETLVEKRFEGKSVD